MARTAQRPRLRGDGDYDARAGSRPTTAMLAIADSVLLRPLGLPHSGRIDSLGFIDGSGEQWDTSWKNYEALRGGVKSFEVIAAYGSLPAPVSTTESSLVKLVAHATPSLFQVAGVKPLLGRTLVDADARAQVAVIGNGYWRDTLHGDPHSRRLALPPRRRLRGRRIAACGGGHLRRAGLHGRAADARDRHKDGARVVASRRSHARARTGRSHVRRGHGAGLRAVWPAARSIRSFLFGVPVLDPVTFAQVALLLGLVCLVAAAAPARRAAAVDPMQALRAE